MNNITIPEDIKGFTLDIQERVSECFDVYLGGGLLRDLYCDLQPKDVDVFFVPKQENIKEVTYIPPKCYVNYNKLTLGIKNSGDLRGRGVYQVVGMFNRSLSIPEVQFIVYNKFLSEKELARDFDLGICQIVWSAREDTIYMAEGFIEDHTHKVIRCLHDYDLERTYRRFERMLHKFPDYTPIGMPEMEVLPEQEQKERKAGTYKRPTFTGSFIAEDL